MAVLLFSTYTDIKKGKVLNKAFYPVLALSLTVPFVVGVWPFLLRLGLVLLVFLAYDGFFGEGDAKLIMMLIMLGSPMKSVVSVLIGTLTMLLYSFVINPNETKANITTGIIAIKENLVNVVKGKGSTIFYAPFLTVGFIVATIIYGI